MDNRLKKFYKENSSHNVALSESAQQRVKANILSNLGSAENAAAPISVWDRLRSMLLRSYILAPLVCVLFLAGTGIASANSVPGDKLYNVKRKLEDARLFVTPTEEAKLKLKVDFAENRLEELEKIRSVNTSDELEPKQESVQSEESPVLEEVAGSKDDEYKPQKGTRAPKEKAREQANDAFKFLKEVQKDLEKKGEEKKSQDINKRIENFRIRLNDREIGHDR